MPPAANHVPAWAMRIAYLIAGAGGMYCGSCLRDNRIAATLIGRGRDLVAIPLYSPLRTDEEAVTAQPVQYGGVGLYLAQRSALFRRLPARVQRLLDSPTLLRLASRLAVKTDAGALGALAVAMLRSDSPAHARHLGELIEHLQSLDPDVVHIPTLMLMGVAAPLKAALRAAIVCTLSGEDVFLDALPEPHRSTAADLIRQAVGHADAFIAPTQYYARLMIERFGLAPGRVHHVPLGVHCVEIEPAAAAPAPRPFVIGYLARVAPEKGLANLAEAFVQLCDAGRDCTLRAAGFLPAEHRSYLRRIRDRIRAARWHERFEYIGEVDRDGKLAFLRGLQCFSVPAVHPEPKGLYALEAMMCGVPVVLPRAGSFPEIVEATGGGVLYDANSDGALASAIAGLMDDPAARARLGRRGREAVCATFTTEAMADAAWEVFQKVPQLPTLRRELLDR